ncbi:entericidin A/B family lipoprotein [Neisseria sp. Ec49-e6-T10]
MKKIIIATCVLCFALAGCNTVKGVGKDIQKGGEALENSAN